VSPRAEAVTPVASVIAFTAVWIDAMVVPRRS
jgi:hypothetical protein